jgi:hypothetical protein
MMHKAIILIGILTVALGGCSKNSAPAGSPGTTARAASASPQTAASSSGDFSTKVPSGWVVEKPTSDMRFAQYKLPKADGGTEDALLVVYYFGPGQGGTPEANIERWLNQVKQPDGSDSKDKAKTGKMTVNGLQVSTVDVLGNYSGGMSPDSAPKDNKTIYRLRGAIVETPKGSYFVKLTGPEKTVNHWEKAYDEYINSFEFK